MGENEILMAQLGRVESTIGEFRRELREDLFRIHDRIDTINSGYRALEERIDQLEACPGPEGFTPAHLDALRGFGRIRNIATWVGMSVIIAGAWVVATGARDVTPIIVKTFFTGAGK